MPLMLPVKMMQQNRHMFLINFFPVYDLYETGSWNSLAVTITFT